MPYEPELQPNVETLTISRKIPTLVGNGRWKRPLRTRKPSCMKWCASKMKAKEINELDWNKMGTFGKSDRFRTTKKGTSSGPFEHSGIWIAINRNLSSAQCLMTSASKGQCSLL